MTEEEMMANQKEFANIKDIMKDTLQCDPKALEALDMKNLDLKAIQKALDFLMNNEDLSQKEKSDLLNESWRINYRAKPPTPEEFITEKYMGPAAIHTYDRIKKVFYEFMNPQNDYRNLILYPHIGWGKGLSYNHKILTPKGYVLAKDIQVGDEVCTPDGKTSHVAKRKRFPNIPIYKVNFGDHRSTKVFGNHYWKAGFGFNNKLWDKEQKKYVTQKKAKPSWKIITTEEILKDMQENGKKHHWFIPVTKPVYHEEREHIIPPYTLGAFLGDGCFASDTFSIVNDDYEIMERIMHELDDANIAYRFKDYTDENGNKVKRSVKYELYIVRHTSFYNEIKRLKLSGTDSHSKFIPEEYLYDSIENRIALLQGLMDTDGSVTKKESSAHATFYTSGEQLVKDVRTLVSGLGASRATLHERERYREGRIKNISHEYRLDITFPDNSVPVFSLERKQELLDSEYLQEKSGHKQQTKPQVLHIESIELTEEKGGVCIETDDDERLFLVDDYIVTHNSYLSAVTTLFISTHVALMRNPWKYFGLNPATVLCQMLCSFSLKKSSELLLEPFFNLLESSPFFEKVHTREAMAKKDAEFRNVDTIDKIYYTTAAPTSDIAFSGGCNIKCVSSPQGLLGASIISIALSELAFFTLAGKALDLDEEVIMADGSRKAMRDIQIGDRLYSPTMGTSTVECIPWEDKDDLYEITVDDGRTVRCNARHLWPVTYWGNDGVYYDTIVETQFMIDHPEIEFDIKSIVA